MKNMELDENKICDTANKFIGVAAGVAAYHFTKNLLKTTYYTGSKLTRIGCRALSLYVGVNTGEKLTGFTNDIYRCVTKFFSKEDD